MQNNTEFKCCLDLQEERGNRKKKEEKRRKKRTYMKGDIVTRKHI